MKKARVKEEHRNRYVLQTEDGDVSAIVRGKLHLENVDGTEVPKVGDYVYYEIVGGSAVITKILPRGNSFIRRKAHDGTPQIIVTNVDVGIIVQGLDGDFNINRLKRYMELVKQSGAKPIVVLNKCDVVSDIEGYKKAVKEMDSSVPLYIISAKKKTGINEFVDILKEGETAVFLGSSGVGKSTITNLLLSEEKQSTSSVRERDSRGKHTTTSRQLFALPNGAFIIDTPGMRELALVGEENDDDTHKNRKRTKRFTKKKRRLSKWNFFKDEE